MNDRARALAILKQAREILARRLTERVLDSAEELLDDARGESYMSEIESLFEQVGTPLAHLNQIIGALPPEEDETPPATHAQHPTPHSYAEVVPPAWPDVPGLPAPRSGTLMEVPAVESVAHEAPAEVSFQTFAVQIQAGDVEGAGQALAVLFDISRERAMQCAQHFHQQMLADNDFLLKAMQLRRELQSGGYNGALMLLFQCFGLSGMESIGVFQVLKARVQMGNS
ncbi:MAG TPA: hypothetical protein VL096_00125 [Pirellulaceae bacterium]|nr:hypothetical protein [Pirellulaceae bacterium]